MSAQTPVEATVDLVMDRLPEDISYRAPNGAVRSMLRRRNRRLVDDAPSDAVLLVAGELRAAGEHAERLLAEVVGEARPGGWLCVSVDNSLHRALHGSNGNDHDGNDPNGNDHDGMDHDGREGGRSWRPDEIAHLLGVRGTRLVELWAPGVASALAGRAFALHPRLDREPSLLGAGATLLAIARTPRDPAERSDVFFSTLPSKTVASATIVRDAAGRMLIVYDRFKSRWTIPGGVVDHDEDPQTAAVRETREESGLDVETTGLLGVFHGHFPDRLVFVFGATPVDGVEPAPIHTHEIGAAAWVSVDEATERVAAHTAEQIRLSLDAPGRVWHQG